MSKVSLSLVLALLGSVGVAAASAACASSTEPTLGSGSKDAGTTTTADARRPYPSFRDDVVPIVQQSCALTACHSSKESNLGIFLAYDPAQIYAELKKTSPTASGEPFVVPGDPAKSYLMVKLEGRQGALSAKCPNGNCGVAMPPDAKLPDAELETIRKWITDGAKDD